MSRVALVTTSFPSAADDAAGHFVASEARHLAREHELLVLAPAMAGGRPLEAQLSQRLQELPHGGVFGAGGALARLRQAPWRAPGLAAFLLAARHVLERWRPERLIAHWLLPGLLLIDVGHAQERELVVHGSDAELLLRWPPWLQRRLLLRARGCTLRCVSSELRARLAPLHAGPLRVEASPIEVPPLTRALARQALGVEGRLVVSLARLIPSKRVAVAAAATRRLGVTHVVLGDGPERPALEAHYPHVRWLGHRPREQALTWLAAADALLSASLREGAPTVVREARALAVPVVSPDVADLARWARRDPGIFLSSGADPVTLRQTLLRCLALTSSAHLESRPPSEVHG